MSEPKSRVSTVWRAALAVCFLTIFVGGTYATYDRVEFVNRVGHRFAYIGASFVPPELASRCPHGAELSWSETHAELRCPHQRSLAFWPWYDRIVYSTGLPSELQSLLSPLR